MQGLWSRAATSSQSTCRCVSCLSTITNGLSSRTTTAAARRRLRIGNSLTIFYSSVFAGAALADARAKAQRRSELEQKIAAVKEEVDELAHEEERLLKTIATRRRRRVTLRAPQKRFYSTHLRAGNARETAGTLSSSHFPASANHAFGDEGLLGELTESEKASIRDDADEQADEIPIWGDSSVHQWVEDSVRIKALQKLAVKQLALRLVLRPIIAHDYEGITVDHIRDHTIPPLNVAELMAQLNRVRIRIHAIKQGAKIGAEDLVGPFTTMQYVDALKQNKSLDADLEMELDAFLAGDRSLPEVLFFISDNLLRSADPDRYSAFRMIIFTFTRARHNDIVRLVLRAVLPYYFSLSSSLIITIVSYFRKAKDLKGFDMFLRMLTGDGYPAKVPILELYARRNINGVEVVVPPLDSHNFVIYTELINAALRFDQPHRADAWLQAAREKGFMDNYATLSPYLRFYAIRRDWHNGLHALQRAVAYMTSSTAQSEERIERLIMRMVKMCDECRQPRYADLIIGAAVRSGFDPAIPSRQHDIDDRVDPGFERWRAAAADVEEDALYRPTWEKCYLFSRAVGPELSTALALSRDTSGDSRAMLGRASESFLLTALTNDSLGAPRGPDSASLSNGKLAGMGTDTAPNIKPESRQSTDSAQAAPAPLPNSHGEELEELRNEVSELRQMIIRLRLSTQFKVQPTQSPHQQPHLAKSPQAREATSAGHPNDSIPAVAEPTGDSGYRRPSDSSAFPDEKDALPRIQIRYLNHSGRSSA